MSSENPNPPPGRGDSAEPSRTNTMSSSPADAASAANVPAPGQILSDRYRLERELGRGGMGRAFVAAI